MPCLRPLFLIDFAGTAMVSSARKELVMANVLLVSYAGYPYTPSSLCPDNGLGILAAVLREAGHHVRILDYGTLATVRRLFPQELSQRVAPLLQELSTSAAAQSGSSPLLLQELAKADEALQQHQTRELEAIADEVLRKVDDLEPALVGFKLWNGDGFSGSVAIAERIRCRHPSLCLIAGGPHATWCGPYIYERTDVFDAVILGEAEQRIAELVACAVKGRPLDDLPGIVRSAQDRSVPPASMDLAELPRAVYDEDVYPAMADDQKLKLIVLDDSRGCPYCCAFCTHPYESGQRLRTRPATRIVDDMEAYVCDYGVRAFRFAGSSTPGSLMAEVAQEILRRGLDVAYTSFAHFSSSLPNHFEIMRRSGLRALFFGLETGSEELLHRATGKPLKLDEVVETVRAAKAAGIAVACSMIVPLPFETEETLEESLRLLLALRPDSVPVQFPGLLPGSRWLEEPEAYGFEVDRDQYMRENMDYKIKLLFPPTFWKPLPYKLNGRSFDEFIKITLGFAAKLEANGLLTNVPDDNMLMAELTGMDYRAFRDGARAWCALGLADALQQFVSRFNSAASPSS